MREDSPIGPRSLRRLLVFGAVLPGAVGLVGLVGSLALGDLLMFGVTVAVLVVFGGTERWVARRPDDTVFVVTLVSLLVVLALIPFYGGLKGPLMVALLSPVLLSGSSRHAWFGRLVMGIALATVLVAYLVEVAGFEPLHQDTPEVWGAVLLSIVMTAALFSSRTIGGHRDMVDHARLQEQRARDALAERSAELGRRLQAEGELQAALRRAEDASQAKSTFLANMSHELRTPLNAIIGYAEMLQEVDATPDQVHDLARIERSGRHLLTLINDILDLSKIEAGRMELHPDDVDLAAFVAEVAEEVRPMMKAQANTFRVQDDATERDLVADAVRVKQVLLNLLSNAAKFTSHGEVDLIVTNEVRSGHLVLVFNVRDSGEGIATADMGRLFRPFVQASGTAGARRGGTGLGLVLSRHFAEMMDGEVHGVSELGVGSTFSLVVPLRAVSASVDAWTERRIVEASLGERPVALCVAEAAHDLEVLDRRLGQEGILMLPCRDQGRALELVRVLHPVVVVADLDSGGRELLAQLRSEEAFDAVPVIVCSSGKESMPGLLRVAQISKPVQQKGLCWALDRLRVLQATSGGARPRLRQGA